MAGRGPREQQGHGQAHGLASEEAVVGQGRGQA